MAELTLVLGGRKSGKSRFAQDAARKLAADPVYVATARIWDEDFAERVRRHQADRGPEWRNVECEKSLSSLSFADGAVVLLDCITLWLTNFLMDAEGDRDQTMRASQEEWHSFLAGPVPDVAQLIVVSNEVGFGVHPESDLANRFADVQGMMNQRIARDADRVVLLVAGIPTYIKGDDAWLRA